ncbi:MAG: hypothetical protein PF541_09215 [Prolixibacteraceae bacterium]|jgi:hypothetical protein|nr:hypothetical protein [Prolixibacteraceae bacterium]
MNSLYDIQLSCDTNRYSFRMIQQIVRLFFQNEYSLFQAFEVNFSATWRPVQMGWFTSSYCSSRSCVG